MIKIKKLHEDAKIPTRGSDEAAGLDLYALASSNLGVGVRSIIKTGIAITIPKGFYGHITTRSGLAINHGVDVLGGIIDSDYRGEIKVILINHGYFSFSIKKGERIAQLIIKSYCAEPAIEVEELDETKRGAGGFGSTGK